MTAVHRRVVILLIGLALSAVAFALSVGAVGRAQADDAPADPPSGEAPIDPVTEALGATTPEAIAELQNAQEKLTDISQTDSAQGAQINAVRSELGDAVDELYDGLADDPLAEHGQGWWRQCMAARGTPFDSPIAIEEAIDSPRSNPDEIQGHALDDVLTNRDDCEQKVSHLLSTTHSMISFPSGCGRTKRPSTSTKA